MAPALITQAVLPGNPNANCDSYITGLLDEVSERFSKIPTLPVGKIEVDAKTFLELRGAVRELNLAVRNQLKWTRAA